MNLSSLSPVTLAAIEKVSEAPVPVMQWWVTGGCVLAVLVGMLIFAYRTRSGIIARATTKEAVRQPVFLLLWVIAGLSIVVNTFVPFFSLGEDIKMLKDCGLATLLISGMLLAVWTSSTSIANEIEGKTAMTLLSKPINRRQFVAGKYVGIMQAVLLLLIPLMILFLMFIYFKVGYDAKEAGQEVPEYWNSETMMPNMQRLEAVTHILPGLVLIVLEIAVVAAVSVAISTRMPMVVNMVTCLAIFVIGHLTPVLVQSTLKELEFVTFMAQLIATVLPSLEVFNIQAAIATGATVPPIYLGYATLYCAAYCMAAILLAFLMFEDRDLA